MREIFAVTGPVHIPIASLNLASENHSTRTVDETYAMEIVPWLQTLDANSSNVTVVGCIPKLFGTIEETRAALSEGNLEVEVTDGKSSIGPETTSQSV